MSYRARIKYRGRILTSTHRDRARAERWVAENVKRIRDDHHFAGESNRRRALAELIDRYLEQVVPHKRDKRSPRRHLRWWQRRLGQQQVGSISRALIAQCRDELLTGPNPRGPATVVRYLASLSHLFTIAICDWEWADTNPVKGVRRPKEPRGRDRYLTDDERERVLDACRGSASADLFTFVLTALCTGMRRGEVATLEWRDVDFARAQITLRDTKNGSRRGVPLCSPALEALKARSKVRRIDTPLVFPGADPSRPVDVTKPWRTALRRARVSDFRFHDLRHSAASYLAMSGATPLDIAAILGHNTLAMTKRYSHLSVDHLKSVLERANEGVRRHA